MSRSPFSLFWSAGLISLARYKTAILDPALPTQQRGTTWRGRRPACPPADLGHGMAVHLQRWCLPLVPVEEVIAHPPPGSPRYARDRPISTAERKKFLSYTKDKKRPNVHPVYRFSRKYFFIALIPRFTLCSTAPGATPSSRAISR